MSNRRNFMSFVAILVIVSVLFPFTSNAQELEKVGQIYDHYSRMYSFNVHDDYLYLNTNANMQIFDISDIHNPEIIPFSNFFYGMLIQDGVVMGRYGNRIVLCEFTESHDINIVGELELYIGSDGLAVKDNYLYINTLDVYDGYEGGSSNTLWVYDISTPDSPELVYSLNRQNTYVSGLSIFDDYLIGGQYFRGGDLTFWDISDPEEPEIIEDEFDDVRSFYFYQDYMFCLALDYELSKWVARVYACDALPEKVLVSEIDSLNTVRNYDYDYNGVGVDGDRMWIKYYENEESKYALYDITNPEDIKLITSDLNIGDFLYMQIIDSTAITVAADYDNSDYSLNFWDIHDVDDPDLIEKVEPADHEIATTTVVGDFAYVKVDDRNTFRVVDISDPYNLEEIDTLVTEDYIVSSVSVNGLMAIAYQAGNNERYAEVSEIEDDGSLQVVYSVDNLRRFGATDNYILWTVDNPRGRELLRLLEVSEEGEIGYLYELDLGTSEIFIEDNQIFWVRSTDGDSPYYLCSGNLDWNRGGVTTKDSLQVNFPYNIRCKFRDVLCLEHTYQTYGVGWNDPDWMNYQMLRIDISDVDSMYSIASEWDYHEIYGGPPPKAYLGISEVSGWHLVNVVDKQLRVWRNSAIHRNEIESEFDFGHQAIGLKIIERGGSNLAMVTFPNTIAIYDMSDYLEVGRVDLEPLPATVMLNPAYPNPFNDRTMVSFSLPRAGTVELGVYDLQGRMVQRIVDGREMKAGMQRMEWSAEGVSSGQYYLKLKFGDEVETRGVTLVK